MEKKKNIPLLLTIAAALILVGCVIAFFSFNSNHSDLPTTTSMVDISKLPTLPAHLLGDNMEETTEETTSIEEPSTVVEAEAETVAHYSPSSDNSRIYFTNFQFHEVGPEYFDDAVFIGNSRMQGFVLYSKLENLTAYTSIGMSVHSYFTKTAYNKDGVEMSASEALEHTENFNKVYIKLGINEIGYTSPEPYIDGYVKILEHIYSCNPNAIIYVFSVLPVSKNAMEKDPSLDINKIHDYNDALQVMCAKYGAVYLDVASIFTDEEGFMPAEAAFDGVHLNANSVQILLDYLLKHGI